MDGDAGASASGRASVNDLPPLAHQNNRWRLRFVTTVIKFIGTRQYPWNAPSLAHLQLIWDHVMASDAYGDPYPWTLSNIDDRHYAVVSPVVIITFPLSTYPDSSLCNDSTSGVRRLETPQ